MKTLLTFLLLFLALFTSFSQEAPKTSVSDSINQVIKKLKEDGVPHFTFKDIPMDGSVTEFADQLIKQGFTIEDTNSLGAVLSGSFTGKDVYIVAQATPKTKTVYGVTVVYPQQTSWKVLKSDYDNIKSMLTVKYREPFEVIEEFDDPMHEKYGTELLALRQEKCTFMSSFSVKENNGMIILKISSDAGVVINYIDSLNFLLQQAEAYNDL